MLVFDFGRLLHHQNGWRRSRDGRCAGRGSAGKLGLGIEQKRCLRHHFFALLQTRKNLGVRITDATQPDLARLVGAVAAINIDQGFARVLEHRRARREQQIGSIEAHGADGRLLVQQGAIRIRQTRHEPAPCGWPR